MRVERAPTQSDPDDRGSDSHEALDRVSQLLRFLVVREQAPCLGSRRHGGVRGEQAVERLVNDVSRRALEDARYGQKCSVSLPCMRLGHDTTMPARRLLHT